eukprot:scaffold29158_cov51-Isochrysis_galbana.AAC.1
MDAAFAQLRAASAKQAPVDPLSSAGIPRGDPRRAALPDGARVAVVGAESLLGMQIVSAIARGGAGLADTAGGAPPAADTAGEAPAAADTAGGAAPRWRVVALCTASEPAAGWLPEGADARAFTPFVPTALARALGDVSAVVICTEAACGKGGVEAK